MIIETVSKRTVQVRYYNVAILGGDKIAVKVTDPMSEESTIASIIDHIEINGDKEVTGVSRIR